MRIDEVSLTVDYGNNGVGLVAAGGYGFKNPGIVPGDITTTRSGVHALRAKLVAFDDNISGMGAHAKLREMNLRGGEPHELLEIRIEYPEMQTLCEIVALGPDPKDTGSELHEVMCLGSFGAIRRLSLRQYSAKFGPTHVFLAFDNPPLAA